MADVTTTRRALLGGIGLASIAGAAVAVPMTSTAGTDGGFSDAVRAYRHANAVSQRYYTLCYKPAYVTMQDCIDKVPPVAVVYHDDVRARHELRTGDSFANWYLGYFRRDRKRFEDAEPAWAIDAIRRFDRGEKARDAEIERIRESSGLGPLVDRCDKLGEEACRLLDAAIACPVTNAAEYVVKLDLIGEAGSWEEEATQTALRADARRLAGAA